ncbi:MAG: hypothetical protein U1C55_06925 [Smithellaceae bacterium]|nr:hypothetical protein [Smithellaceae bacterium]
METKQETEKTQDRQTVYNSFEHRYKFDVQSFVLSPRLLNYQLGLSIAKGVSDSDGASSSIDNLGYNIRTELFSGRRINGSLYAMRDATSSFTPMSSSLGATMVSQKNTSYGMLLNLNYRAFPLTIAYDENMTEGSSGAQQIDRGTRRVQLNANKDIYGFSGSYGYAYTDTADHIEQTNNATEHTATANLEKKLSDVNTFRQDFRFSSSSRLGKFQDITSPTVTKTTDYTLTRADEIVRFDAVLTNLTATLPSAVGDAGRTFTIVKIDATANTVTVKPAGAETINGATSLILPAQWSEATIVSNGINWITGTREQKKGPAESSSIINLNSHSTFSYRPSRDFSNDSALNLFYFNYETGPGANLLASNSTNYQVNPQWSVNANASAGYADSGTGGTTSTGNVSAGINYDKKIGNWNLRLFENMGLHNSNQTAGQGKTTGNAGIGASASRDYDWFKSNLLFQTQAAKSASSGGGGTTSWQSSGAWGASPSERFQLQSSLRYSREDSINEAIVVTAASDAEATTQPYASASQAGDLDLSYSWLAYVSENKMATVSGGAVLSRQENKADGGGSTTTDRNYFYNQLIFRMAPLRSLFVSATLRGEWDNSAMETTNASGNITRSSKPRTLYSMENAINFRVRRLFLELLHNWRDETGTINPYNRQSIYFKISRPF